VNAKKILITTESHEIFVLRTGERARAYGQCFDCECEVEILTLDRAVTHSGIRTGELIRMAERNKVHSIETSMGHLLICKKSLDGHCRERREDK
jgi:hypothetical protein